MIPPSGNVQCSEPQTPLAPVSPPRRPELSPGSFDHLLASSDQPCAPFFTGDNATLRSTYCWRCSCFGPISRSASCRRAAPRSCCRSARWESGHPCPCITCTTTWACSTTWEATLILKTAPSAALPARDPFPNTLHFTPRLPSRPRPSRPSNPFGRRWDPYEFINLAALLLSLELMYRRSARGVL
jgi:hypothetical protein